MDYATLHWILTQLHLTVGQMDTLIVLEKVRCELKHSPDVKNQVADSSNPGLDVPWERCNLIALQVTTSGE
jgi:hypothetical protein